MGPCYTAISLWSVRSVVGRRSVACIRMLLILYLSAIVGGKRRYGVVQSRRPDFYETAKKRVLKWLIIVRCSLERANERTSDRAIERTSVRARACACVCACLRVCVRACVLACVRACVLVFAIATTRLLQRSVVLCYRPISIRSKPHNVHLFRRTPRRDVVVGACNWSTGDSCS